MGGKKSIPSSSICFVGAVIDNKIFKNTVYIAIFKVF